MMIYGGVSPEATFSNLIDEIFVDGIILVHARVRVRVLVRRALVWRR